MFGSRGGACNLLSNARGFSIFCLLLVLSFSFHPLFNMGENEDHYFIFGLVRCFVTAGESAMSPSTSRMAEAMCIQLCNQCTDKQSSGPKDFYVLSKEVVLKRYISIRHAVNFSCLCKQAPLMILTLVNLG